MIEKFLMENAKFLADNAIGVVASELIVRAIPIVLNVAGFCKCSSSPTDVSLFIILIDSAIERVLIFPCNSLLKRVTLTKFYMLQLLGAL